MYPLVLLSAFLLCFECWLIGFIVVVPARTRTFTKEFMAQFEDTSVGGWPDNGEGRYSEKLPYRKWFDFNNAMRVHQNFVEQLPISLIFLSVGGLVLPRAAWIIGFLNVIARALNAAQNMG